MRLKQTPFPALCLKQTENSRPFVAKIRHAHDNQDCTVMAQRPPLGRDEKFGGERYSFNYTLRSCQLTDSD
jgi:hypothetical protein